MVYGKTAVMYWEVEVCENHDGGSVWIVEEECIEALSLAEKARARLAKEKPSQAFRVVEVTRRVVER